MLGGRVSCKVSLRQKQTGAGAGREPESLLGVQNKLLLWSPCSGTQPGEAIHLAS